VSRVSPLDKTRNIGIMAHIDAGRRRRPSVALLHRRSPQDGEVHDGTATMDWMEQEQERASHHLRRDDVLLRGHRINIIDTPGHVDFTIEVERSLRVLDGAVAVFCASAAWSPSPRRCAAGG